MNIYEAIADFTEEVLLNQLQNPIALKNITEMKRNKFSSEPSLIDQEGVQIENKEDTGENSEELLGKKYIKREKNSKGTYSEIQQCILNARDITKSIDSGVYLETRELENGTYPKENVRTYSMGKQFGKEKPDDMERTRQKFSGKGYQSECYLSLNIRQEQKKPLILYFKKGDLFAVSNIFHGIFKTFKLKIIFSKENFNPLL